VVTLVGVERATKRENRKLITGKIRPSTLLAFLDKNICKYITPARKAKITITLIIIVIVLIFYATTNIITYNHKKSINLDKQKDDRKSKEGKQHLDRAIKGYHH